MAGIPASSGMLIPRGADYVPLMLRADDLWCELQDTLGLDIVHRTGILEMDSPGTHHSHNAREAARKHGIPYDWLTPRIRYRWPAITPQDDWEGEALATGRGSWRSSPP